LAPTEAAGKTDVEFDVGSHEKTLIMQPGVLADMAAVPDPASQTVDITSDSGVSRAAAEAAAAPDFSLDLPPDTRVSAEPDITLDSPGRRRESEFDRGLRGADGECDRFQFRCPPPRGLPTRARCLLMTAP
jgi:hypothetical protein